MIDGTMKGHNFFKIQIIFFQISLLNSTRTLSCQSCNLANQTASCSLGWGKAQKKIKQHDLHVVLQVMASPKLNITFHL